MRNKDLRAELEKFPDDLVVEIEGYAAGTETENKSFEITAVDGWQKEDGSKGVTVWSRQIGDVPSIGDELLAENERLRSALEEIASYHDKDTWTYQHAKAALHGEAEPECFAP